MSMYLFPKTTIKTLASRRKKFLWQGGGDKKKYHLINWERVCTDRRKGGLGIKNLKLMNICLMCKWWWKLKNEKGIWQEIVNKKYFLDKGTLKVESRATDSHAWSDLVKVKEYYIEGRQIDTRSGDKTSFWEDPWHCEMPLAISDPELYDICNDKDILVMEIREKNDQLDFRRWFCEDGGARWYKILEKFHTFDFQDLGDYVVWKWEKRKWSP